MNQVNDDDQNSAQDLANSNTVQPNNDDQNIQKNDDNAQITARPSGSAEVAPVSVEKSEQNVEDYVHSSESHLEVSEEEEKAGVKIVREPRISSEAKDAGIEESVPTGFNFNISFSSKDVAEEKFEKGNVNNSSKWRALIAFKVFAKNLISSSKPQEAK